MTKDIMSKLSKYITIGLYATLLLPLLYIPGIYLAWNFGKIMVFQILVEVILIMWLVNLKSINIKNWLKQLNWLDWSLIIFVAVLIVASFTGINFSVSFWGNFSRATGAFTWLHFLVWYFLLKHYWQNNKGWKNGFNIAIIVGLLVSLTIFLDSVVTPWQSIANGGIIGNRAFASAYLIIVFGIAGYQAMISNKLIWRLVYIFSSVILLIAIIFCGIRGALLGLITAIIIWFVLLIINLQRGRAKIICISILAAGLVVLVALGTIFYGGKYKNSQPFLAKIFDVQHYLQGTGETRLMAWQIAWQGLKSKPLLGWGPGNYEAIFSKFYNPQFFKYGFTETVWDKPHNWLLEVGSASGLLGVASYLFIYFCAIYYVLKPTKESSENNNFNLSGRLLISSLLIGYFIQNLFIFETSASLQLFFFLLAFLSGQIINRAANAENSNFSVKPMREPASVLLGLLIVFIFVLMWKNSFLPLKAAYYLQAGTKSQNFEEWENNVSKYLSVPVSYGSEGAVFLAEQFVKLDKADVKLAVTSSVETALTLARQLTQAAVKQSLTIANHVWAGQIYLVLGERLGPGYLNLAEQNLKAAVNLSPNKQDALFLLGRLYLLKKDYNNAYVYLQKAVQVEPTISTSHWFYGLALVAGNNKTEGVAEMEAAINLGYSSSLEQKLYMLDLYTQLKNYDKVIVGYQNLLAVEPENVNWRIKLAAAYILAGNKAEALNIINQVSAQYPFLKGQVDGFIKQNKLK